MRWFAWALWCMFSLLPLAAKETDFFERSARRYARGDYRGAIADCTRALKLNPKLAKAYNGRGVAKSRLGDYRSAIADFDQALQLDASFASAYSKARRMLRDFSK